VAAARLTSRMIRRMIRRLPRIAAKSHDTLAWQDAAC